MPDLSAMLERGPVVCAEGYLFECERRGYLQAGAFVPEVVLDHPEVVTELHREFVHAGSDMVEAFTYYGHRPKLRVIGKEDILEPLNRQALSVAAAVARQTGALLAGNICNTNVYEPSSPAVPEVRAAFEEQVAWAAEAGADMIIAETFSWLGEALLALEVIRAAGLPAVVTFAVHRDGTLRDVDSPEDACRQAEQAGATVVGLNCIRGPRTMLPLLGRVREAVACEVAALPVPYRTTEAEPTMQSLHDPVRGGAQAFPTSLDPFTCTREELSEFAAAALALGVRYLGVCCGAAPHHIRAVAEAAGRTPPASRYSPDMSRHSFLGTASGITPSYQDYASQL
ncbi:MAG TPA: homocysteine S-methyltransferase family protein [Streptosporangiaceae bacterium]|nr:homocysteine S-methyltransferase family protein [Streptosporangiaceae bacterium]